MQVLDSETSLAVGALGRLAELARTVGALEIAADAEALDARLSAGRMFVACVGQFKRGKSTFGSVFADNTNATRRFVPHVDAALVVLGADPPISADELELVSEIAREAPALVFVMAKADRLGDADLVEARAFTERVLADRLDREASPPLMVSATERVSLGRPTRDWPRLEEQLIRLGSTERAALLQARHARGAARLGGQLLVQIDEERRILEQPLEDAERRVAALVEWTAQAEIALRELGFRLAAEVQHFGSRL